MFVFQKEPVIPGHKIIIRIKLVPISIKYINQVIGV